MVDANGNEFVVGDYVLVLGKVTALAPGIHQVVMLDAQQQGQTLSMTYYANDLRKGVVDGQFIKGDLAGPGR